MTPTSAASVCRRRQIALWLFACCALLFAMVVLGGVTRLTRSGLSIVEWQPLLGAIPPLTETDWMALFEKYRQTPEYHKVNVGMDLAGFKEIFWLEYLHRLLGRLIGVVFLVPFLYFLLRRRIERALTPKLLAMFVLGGVQGALGWFMVKSGLVDVPRVSAYRLTAHLGLAVAIYGYMLWVALDLWYGARAVAATNARLRRFSAIVTGLVFLMILSGGLVAGTRAGFAFNSFPLMHGQFLPAGMYAMQPWWADPFENIATVQFNHRLLAYGLCVAIPALWFVVMRAGGARGPAHALVGVLAVQVTLGILTLIHVVPVPLAAAHQAGALALFSVALYLGHALRRAPA